MRCCVLWVSIVVFSWLSHLNCLSQVQRIWLNPGVKVAYTFGEDGGFTVGPEVSVVWETEKNLIGVLVDVDHCQRARRMKLHVGIEAMGFPFPKAPVGLSAGPTIIWQDSKTAYGVTVTGYTGLGLIPFVGSTIRTDGPVLVELGSYLKIPIIAHGPRFKM